MKTQMKAMWAVLVMTTLWLTINSTKINSHIEEQKQLDTIVQKMVEELEETEELEEAQAPQALADKIIEEVAKKLPNLEVVDDTREQAMLAEVYKRVLKNLNG